MVDAATKQSSHLVQGRADGDLWLRVLGTARNGQLIRLSAPKCTIGSAQGCTLRLRAAGVRPVSCLILRGTRGTVARTSTGGARLNGRRFSDAALVPGDRLTVGPIDLEVLAGDAAPVLPQGPDAAQVEPRQEPDLRAETAGRCLREQATSARRRARNLIRVARDLRAEIARLDEQSQTQRSELHEEAAAWQQSGEEYERIVASWKQQCQQWESTAQQHQQELDGDRAELAELRKCLAERSDELNAVRAELQTQRQELEALRQSAGAEQGEAAEQLAAERERLDAERAELERERGELAKQVASCDERGAQHEHRQNELDEERARLDDARTELDRERAELKAELANAAQAHADLEQERAELERRQQELNESDAQLGRREAEVEQARAELETAQGDIAEAKTEVDVRRAQLDEVEDRLAKSHSELDAGRQQLEQQREALEAAQLEVDHRAQDAATVAADQEHTRIALARTQAEEACWALQRLAWETSLATATDRLERREADLATRQQAFTRQSSEKLESLDKRETRLRELEESLTAQGEQLSQAREKDEARLAEQRRALERNASELEVRRQQLEAEDAARQARHEVRELDIANAERERTRTLDERAAQLEMERQEFQTQQEKLKESAAQLTEHLEQLKQLRRELTEERESFYEERAAWNTRQQTLDTASDAGPVDSDADRGGEEAGEALHAEPQDTGDITEPVLANTETVDTEQSTVALDEADAAEPVQGEAEPIDEELPQRRASDVGEDSEGDTSIEEYMAALLNRMRGGAPSQPVVERRPARRKSDAQSEKRPTVSEASNKPAPVPLLDVVSTPTELARRMPMETSDLAAMREVANRHAKMAIDAHGRKRLLHTALITSSAALGCLLGTFLLLSVVAAHHTALRTLSMAGFVGAVFWLFTAGTALEQLIVARKSQQAELQENIERADRRKSTPTEPTGE